MKTALFAGTFDPPTLGHQEIIQRAALVFDKLYVAVAKSKGKHALLLEHDERISLMKEVVKEIKTVEVIALSGLVVDCAKERGVDCLLRGLRNNHDLDYEMQMEFSNRFLSGIETFYLLASPKYVQINSTLIREIASYGRRLDGFVQKEIEPRIFELLNGSES